jgi:hypothetical protein
MVPRRWLGVVLSSAVMAVPVTQVAAEALQESDAERLRLQERFCGDCHAGEEAEAGLDLSSGGDPASDRPPLSIWPKVLARLEAREMPPPDSGMPLPTDEELARFTASVRALLRSAPPQAGPALMRRLNKYEYNATLRDLLGVHAQPGASLPADGGGGSGFDNAGETLFMSPVHAEMYLEAARTALDYMAKDPLARELIFADDLPEEPDDATTRQEPATASGRSEVDAAARAVLGRFMRRAFRRPVTAEELDNYLRPYRAAFDAGGRFEPALMRSLEAVLVSPHFLFLVEQPNRSPQPRRISDYELATRLSYFLWSSMPDDELLDLAARGKLGERTILRHQVLRMLNSRTGNFDRGSEYTKARALAENFMGQWLGTRELGNEFVPDGETFPSYDEQLEFAMREEPVYLLEHMLLENRPILDLLDSNYTFLTRELARHYGMKDAPLRRFGQMEFVELPDDSDRGGVLTMASVLAVSSYPHRTSPVLRGKWVLEKLLGTPPAPPPPDVPELSQKPEDVAGKTLRERLEIHRQNASCASCHDRLDPLGFGLENYDAIGRWRDEDADKPVDARGTLPSGRSFAGPGELKQILLERKTDFARVLTGRMLSYALGRGLLDSDLATVERIVARLEANDYRIHELILGIVESVPYQYQSPANGSSQSTEAPGEAVTK